MGLMTAIAVGSLAVAGVGAYKQNQANKKNAHFQREAAEFQQKQANLQNARQKRDAVRAARMSYGTAVNNAANQGVMGSSSSQGGLGSISSQAADNVSFLDQFGFYSDQASKSLGNANKAAANAATWAGVSGLGMSVFNNAGPISDIFTGGNG